MRALRWHGRGDIRLDAVPEPGDPAPGEAVIAVSYCGICGTDLHEYAAGPNMIREGAHPLTGFAPPLTLGHEMSGTVVAVGEGVQGVDVGARVTVDPCLRCGSCRWCVRGEYHICARGGSVGLASPGAFADQVVVPSYCLVPVPDQVSDEHAAVAEPLAVGLHAVRRSGLVPGDTVLLLGAGPIGIACLLAAKLAGASAVYVSEPAKQRAELVRGLGATEVFDPTRDDVRRETFLATGRVGPDVVIEATGRSDAAELAVSSVRRGGRAVLAGVSGQDLTVPLGRIVLYERSVVGSLGYNFDIPRVLALIAAGTLDPTPLVTDTRPLSAGPEVFEELAAGSGGQLKVLLSPGGN